VVASSARKFCGQRIHQYHHPQRTHLLKQRHEARRGSITSNIKPANTARANQGFLKPEPLTLTPAQYVKEQPTILVGSGHLALDCWRSSPGPSTFDPFGPIN